MKEIKSKGKNSTPISKEKSFGEVKGKKRMRSEPIKSTLIVKEVEKAMFKDKNIKPLLEWYGIFDQIGQRTLEEATIKYLNIFNKTLIEIMFDIPKILYEVL